MEAAVASHVKKAVRKMRSEGSVANGIQVFINTDRFKKDLPQYYNSASGKLPFPTNDLLTIATEVNRHLQRIFREGYGYKKAGVLLLGLAPEGHQQLPLFADTIKQKRNGRIELKVKRQRLNEAIEDIVQRYGKHTINLGRSAIRPSIRKPHRWQQNRNKLSPNYTTSWSHILTVE